MVGPLRSDVVAVNLKVPYYDFDYPMGLCSWLEGVVEAGVYREPTMDANPKEPCKPKPLMLKPQNHYKPKP